MTEEEKTVSKPDVNLEYVDIFDIDLNAKAEQLLDLANLLSEKEVLNNKERDDLQGHVIEILMDIITEMIVIRTKLQRLYNNISTALKVQLIEDMTSKQDKDGDSSIGETIIYS